MSEVSVWTCPGCGRKFRLPAGKKPPRQCQTCQQAADPPPPAPVIDESSFLADLAAAAPRPAPPPVPALVDPGPVFARTLPESFVKVIELPEPKSLAFRIGKFVRRQGLFPIFLAAIGFVGAVWLASTFVAQVRHSAIRTTEDVPQLKLPAPQPTPPLPKSLRVLWEPDREDDNNGWRRLRAIYTGPLDRESVERDLRQAFEHYRVGIAVFADKDRPKKILIMLSTSKVENDYFGPFAQAETEATLEIPEWDSAKITIENRDKETRPGAFEELLFEAIVDFERRARVQAEAEFPDSPANLLRQQKRQDDLKEQFRKEYIASGTATQLQMDRVRHHWYVWCAGLPATPEAIEENRLEEAEVDNAAQ